jgi:serine phosphatase RsbU (regulator of sigma subunit)
MQGDLFIAGGIENSGALIRVPPIGARPAGKSAFSVDSESATGRSLLIERFEQLPAANTELQQFNQEFQEDLANAARLQRHLEPRPTVWGRVRVDTFSQPARTIGGDFGVVSSSNGEHLDLLLCDVAGHGISAALAASRIFSETNAHLKTAAPLRELLSNLNRFAIHNFNSVNFFFTLAAARIDRSGRHMVFAGAGHPPGMVIKPGAEPQLLGSQSMMLGVLPTAVGNESLTELNLEPGDRVLLYTDGSTEVFDKHGEMLGVEGLQGLVRNCSAWPFEQTLPGILDQVRAWQRGTFADDVTLIFAEIAE